MIRHAWDWITSDTPRIMISAGLIIILIALIVGEVRDRRRR
jgi:hypothetical protein